MQSGEDTMEERLMSARALTYIAPKWTAETHYGKNDVTPVLFHERRAQDPSNSRGGEKNER